MKTKFIPVDYSYFDFEGRNHIKIIGRDEKSKRVCVIDSCPVYFWAILKDNLKAETIKKLQEKIKQAEAFTQEFKKKTMNLAIGYTGQTEIIDAAKKIAEQYRQGNLELEKITTDSFKKFLFGKTSESITTVMSYLSEEFLFNMRIVS